MSNLHLGGGYFTYKNVKYFNLIGFSIVIILLVIILGNIIDVKAVDYSGIGDREPLSGSGGSNCNDSSEGEYYNSRGFRLVILTKDGKRIINQSYDFYHSNSSINFSYGNGCSKIEYILGKCTNNKSVTHIRDIDIRLTIPDFPNEEPTYYPPETSYQYIPSKYAMKYIFEFLESNDYGNLKKMAEKMGYDCNTDKINKTTDKSDKCYIDVVKNTYISVEPMERMRIGANKYYATAYEMPVAAPCYLSPHWQLFAAFKGTKVQEFIPGLIDNYSSVGWQNYKPNSINNLKTINGVMVYKLSDIIDIPDLGKITITKYNGDGTKKLQGSVFALYKVNSDGSRTNLNKTSTTNSSGTAEFPDLEYGTYAIKEITPPSGYQLDCNKYSCDSEGGKYGAWVSTGTVLNSSNPTKSISVYNKPDNQKEIKIEKRDYKTNQLILRGTASFEIYDDSSCRDYTYWYDSSACTNYDTKTKKCVSYGEWKKDDHRMGSISTIKGKASISLPGGKTYYIKETSAPKGYFDPPSDNNEVWSGCSWCTYKQPPSSNCYQLSTSSTTVIYNKNSCETIFNGLNKNSMDDRIWAYRYFKEFIPNKVDYNGLLNLNNRTADTACRHYDCTTSPSTQCLSGKYEIKEFSKTNISCYNSIYSTTTGGTAYCLESFELTNYLNTSNWTVSSGRMPIQYSTPTIATSGSLMRECYKYSTKSDERESKPDSYDEYRGKLAEPKYDDYVSSIKLDGRELTHDKIISNIDDTNNWYEYWGGTSYYLNKIYSKVGTGEISYENLKNYRFIGYGVISKFNVKKTYSIPFSITLGSRFPLPVNKKYNNSDQCIVTPSQEIIITDDSPKKPDELRLEFRIIDTINPFPGKSGSVRKVGTNWRVKSVLNNEYFDYDKYITWKDKSWKNSNFYKNNKGIGTGDDYGFNSFISYIMETTNNSYNKNKTGPKYTIKLTPTDIRKIREYNEKHKYDDFTLNCVNGKNCKLSDEFTKIVTIKGI